jgi:hypothetical protein
VNIARPLVTEGCWCARSIPAHGCPRHAVRVELMQVAVR